MSTYLIPGFLGVDLFFILSGFLIAIVHKDMSLDVRDLGGFYLKRIFRVYPLEIGVMLFMLAYAWWQHKIGPGWCDLHTFLPILLMVQPYYDQPPIIGWLATNWSVGIELGCYLVFPILLVVLRGRGRMMNLIWLLLFLVLEALGRFYYLESFFGPGAVLRGFAGFGLGASMAFVVQSGPRLRVRTTTTIGLGCVAAIGGLLMEQVLWPIPLFMAGLIASLSYRAGPIVRLFEWGGVVWLGKISYSIYLIHSVFMGEWGWWWVAELRMHLPDPVAAVAWVAVSLLVSATLSALTYYGIERPFRWLGQITANRFSRAV